ncbi:MAG: patatin-like phospholipase family protein [Myxococcota bacterium]
MDAPTDIRPDLAERFRQLRPFDEAEYALVQAIVDKPGRLPRRQEVDLRLALNLARLWVIRGRTGDVVVGPQLGVFRDRVRRFADSIRARRDLDPRDLAVDADQLRPAVNETQDTLRSLFVGSLTRQDIDRELRQKALVLALGGGGGCGFVHLGAFSVLQELSLTPRLIAGTSIGAILGIYRARYTTYQHEEFKAAAVQMTFKKMFGVLDSETRYAMPGALRLHLRSALSSHFLNDRGEVMQLNELPITFLAQVTGVRRDAAKGVARYERMFRQELRRGAIGRLLHVRDLVGHGVKFISEMAGTPGALKDIVIGADDQTAGFDTLDAAGFSAALPALVQYDITRNDPRMQSLVEMVLRRHGVDYLSDGGLIANVPARAAWEYVQSGHLTTRNACILGLDCFAPALGRHMLFLPLQRIAAENVARNRPFTQVMYTYRRTLSPTVLVPTSKAIDTATRSGSREFTRLGPLLKKFLEPLVDPTVRP